VLIASSLLLLAIVSALVAFRGWPELGVAEDGAQGLLVEESRAPVSVSEVRVERDGDADRSTSTRSGERSSRDRREGDERGDGRADEKTPGGNGPGAGDSPSAGDQGAAEQGGVAVPEVPQPLPGGTTNRVRNGLNETTQNLTNTVGGLNPNLTAPLNQTGEALGQVVTTVPESGTAPLPGVDVRLP
jgi:hypothetical protein